MQHCNEPDGKSPKRICSMSLEHLRKSLSATTVPQLVLIAIGLHWNISEQTTDKTSPCHFFHWVRSLRHRMSWVLPICTFFTYVLRVIIGPMMLEWMSLGIRGHRHITNPKIPLKSFSGILVKTDTSQFDQKRFSNYFRLR